MKFCPSGPPAEDGTGSRTWADDVAGLSDRFYMCTCPKEWACEPVRPPPRQPITPLDERRRAQRVRLLLDPDA